MFVKFPLMVFCVVFLTLPSIEFATAQLAWSSIIIDSESKYIYPAPISVRLAYKQNQHKSNKMDTQRAVTEPIVSKYSITCNLWIACKHQHLYIFYDAVLLSVNRYSVAWFLSGAHFSVSAISFPFVHSTFSFFFLSFWFFCCCHSSHSVYCIVPWNNDGIVCAMRQNIDGALNLCF